MRVRQSYQGRTRTLLDTADHELARIALALHACAARAGTITEIVDDHGAVIDARVSERRAVYRAIRPPRQGRLFA